MRGGPSTCIVLAAVTVGCSALALFVACGDESFTSSGSDSGSESSANDTGTTTDAPSSADGGVCDGFDAATFELPADASAVCGSGGFPTDLRADTHNCGRCGHDCLGGACVGGQCKPVTIYQEANDGGGVPNFGGAVVGVLRGEVYWFYPSYSGTTITFRRMPVDGSSAPENLTDSLPVWSAALDSSGLYYVDQADELHRFVAGVGDSLLLSVPFFRSGMALDDTNIYLAGSGKVVAIAKSDAGMTTISSAEKAPTDLVVDTSWVEWLDAPWRTVPDAGTALVRYHDGSLVTPTTLGAASGLTVDERRNLYWFDDEGHQLAQLAEDDPAATPTPLGTYAFEDGGYSPRAVQGVVVDGSRVFVGMGATPLAIFEVIEFSVCGAPPKQIARSTGSQVNGRIYQDATALYWTEYGGALSRLAK